MSNYVELGIFLTLLDGNIHTAAKLAEQFEISTKTVYRLTDKLCSAGMPLSTLAGKNGGIFLAGKYKCDTGFFTDQELSYMLDIINSNLNIRPQVAANISAKLNNQVSSKNLFDVIKNRDKLFVDNTGWFATNKTCNQSTDTLLLACKCNREVSFTHHGNSRKVQPYCLVFKQGEYYLYGYCTMRQDFRMFRISKIQDLQVLETTFCPAKINLIDKPWNNTSYKKIEIEIEAEKEILTEVSNWAKLISNSNSRAKFLAIDNIGLTHKLMQYSNKIKIISPAKIAKEIKDECLKIANLYAN